MDKPYQMEKADIAVDAFFIYPAIKTRIPKYQTSKLLMQNKLDYPLILFMKTLKLLID